MEIYEQLLALQDDGYRCFQSGLIPTTPVETMIGVRTPALRRLAKELQGSDQAVCFMEALPHKYYEENNLHAFLIEGIADYSRCMEELQRFLPYVDNWATCDSLSPKIFKKYLPALLEEIRVWLTSGHIYTVRFAIGMLMKWYLDEGFSSEYTEMVASLRSEEYYVNMMIAWYFATALAKQYDTAVSYLEKGRLSPWVHNKTIQKAVESCRISPQRKEHLRRLRWK